MQSVGGDYYCDELASRAPPLEKEELILAKQRIMNGLTKLVRSSPPRRSLRLRSLFRGAPPKHYALPERARLSRYVKTQTAQVVPALLPAWSCRGMAAHIHCQLGWYAVPLTHRRQVDHTRAEIAANSYISCELRGMALQTQHRISVLTKRVRA